MLTPQSGDDWRRLFCELGCEPDVAQARSSSWAATIREDTFSAGLERELPDFLATVLHESQMLERLRENGNYSARRIAQLAVDSGPGTRWRALLPRAHELEGNPDAFFEALYSGRMGNGPEGSGDGARYPGRAYIGMTGKAAYQWMSDRTGQDLLGLPNLAEEPTFALEFTVDWWEGKVPDWVLGDIPRERRIVNGGHIGLPEVERLYNLVRKVLQCSDS